MKRTILLFAFVVANAASSPAAESAAPKLRAGASAVDITPKMFPLNVPGVFTPSMAESAHDPLHARALVLDDGTTTVALVVVDNLQVADLANGNNGYLPTPAQHKFGGYETWLGSNRVQEDASVILTSNLLGMLDELYQTSAEPTDNSRWPKSDRFEKTILAFEAADQTNPPPKHAILFTGASNIVGWKTLTADFPGLVVINRGFGGSHIADCVYYADRIVIPYEPRMIVFRAGGNDLQAGKTPEQVAADFRAFVEKVHAKLPNTRIAYWPMTPSIARLANWDREDKGNRLIKEYIAADKNLIYIDSAEATLGPDGKPRPELFKPDGLHFNAEAYKMFTKTIRPYLE